MTGSRFGSSECE